MALQTTLMMHGCFNLKKPYRTGKEERYCGNHLIITNETELHDLAKKAGIIGEPLKSMQKIDLTSRDIVLLYSFECNTKDDPVYTGVSKVISTVEHIQIITSVFYFPNTLCPATINATVVNPQGWLISSKLKDQRTISVESAEIPDENAIFQEPEFQGVQNTGKLSIKVWKCYELMETQAQKFINRMNGISWENWSNRFQEESFSLVTQQKILDYGKLTHERHQNTKLAKKRFLQLHDRICGPFLGSI